MHAARAQNFLREPRVALAPTSVGYLPPRLSAASSAVCVVISSYSLGQRPPSAVMWAAARRRPAARAHAALALALLAPLAPVPLPPPPPPPLRMRFHIPTTFVF